MLWARDCAHKLHLSTPSYAQHIALEEFYNDLLELFDQLAEVVQGKYGIISSLQVQGSNCEDDACTFICNLVCWLDSKAHACICPDDTFIHNLVDEVQAITYRAKYKIENLK